MINPYNPAPLPRIPTQPTPTIADHFTRMMEPIIQMQQLDMQRQMQQQQMALGERKVQAMDADLARNQRKDERDLRKDQLDDEMARRVQEAYTRGDAIGPDFIYKTALEVGMPVDMITQQRKEMQSEAQQLFNFARATKDPGAFDQLAMITEAVYGIKATGESLREGMISETQTFQDSFGNLIKVKTNASGDFAGVEKLDTRSPEEKQKQDADRRMAELSLQKTELQITEAKLKIQSLLNPPQGAGFEVDQKTVQTQVNNYTGQVQRIISNMNKDLVGIAMSPEARNELINKAVKNLEPYQKDMTRLIEMSDAPESLKRVWRSEIGAPIQEMRGNPLRDIISQYKGSPQASRDSGSVMGALGRDLTRGAVTPTIGTSSGDRYTSFPIVVKQEPYGI